MRSLEPDRQLKIHFKLKFFPVMFKKLLDVQEKRTINVTVPYVMKQDSTSTSSTIPAKLEEIPVLKQVANNKQIGNWKTDYKDVS